MKKLLRPHKLLSRQLFLEKQMTMKHLQQLVKPPQLYSWNMKTFCLKLKLSKKFMMIRLRKLQINQTQLIDLKIWLKSINNWLMIKLKKPLQNLARQLL